MVRPRQRRAVWVGGVGGRENRRALVARGRPELVREYLTAPRETRAWVETLGRQARATTAAGGLIEWDEVWRGKREALEQIFALGRSERRASAFAAFRADGGRMLEDFALWCVLADAGASERGLPSPADIRPGSARARALAAANSRRVEFFCWLQWIAAQQADDAQEVALAAGMGIGVVGDLAVASHPAGADAWIDGPLLARDVEVGAPPDGLSDAGQRWAAHPWHPKRLQEQGYLPFRDLLRAAFAHVGGLRVDHILGLFRLWWIPRGMAPHEGAYVRYDAATMLGILVLEAVRAGALVIGEDLGVVEPGVREALAAHGILGSAIAWFAADDDPAESATGQGDGSLMPRGARPAPHLPPERYRPATMALLTTHDLPPTAAVVSAAHVAERGHHGLLGEDAAPALAAARSDRQRMARFLVEQGILSPRKADDDDAMVEALHVYLLTTRSVLAGVSLGDLVGAMASQNLPGTFREYPNWRVPLADGDGKPVLLEDLASHPRFDRLMGVVAAAARRRLTSWRRGAGATPS
jgi:4-alpha-glucanotransferase